MKKSFIISWCAIFVLIFIAPQLIYFILKPTESANTENRKMADFPQLSLSTIEDFPGEFEAYYNDTLPFRSEIISLNSYVNYKLFNESSNSKVIIGYNNWLFFNPMGTDGDTIGDFQGTNLFTENQLSIILDNLLYIDEALSKQGREFVLFIAPNKESIYGSKYLPDAYQTNNTYTTAD